MTIFEPETVDSLEACECAECGNSTFKALVVLTQRGTVKIKEIKCVVCDDVTKFSPAPPEEFN